MQHGSPSDFDKFFNAPPVPSTPTAHPAFKDPFGSGQPAGGQQSGQPGEFTRMFGVPTIPPQSPQGVPHAPPPQAPPPQPVMGTYTKMFSTLPQQQSPAPPPPPPQGGPPPMPSQPQGGSEFTRMFQVGGQPEAPQSVLVKPTSQPNAQPARRPAKKSSNVPLFVLLGVVLLAIVIVVVVLALRS
jgi:hypothetical protein